MNIGLHVSIASSVDKAVDNARALNCTAFQMFTRKPRELAAEKLVDGEVRAFRAKLESSKIDKYAVCVHMPYFLNLSSPDSTVHRKSLDVLTDEVERCGALGVPYLVIHLGNHSGAGTEVGIKNLVSACNTAIEKAKNDVIILLENSAGAGNSVGSKLEEIRQIIDHVEPRRRFGVCLDTCHAFAAGYDLRTSGDVDRLVDEFDKVIGLKELRIVHLNDSKGELNSNMDRHEHIGLGHIGEESFAAMLTHKILKKVPLIMETPIDSRRDDAGNLKKCKQLATMAAS